MPGGHRTHGDVPKIENPIATFKRLLGFLKDKLFWIIFILILTGLSALISVYATHLTNPVIVAIQKLASDFTDANLAVLFKCLVTVVGAFLLGMTVQFVADFIMVRVVNQTNNKIRNLLFKKMQELPISYFDKHTHGELMSYFTNDVGALRDAISDSLVALISATITLVSTFAMMLMISWKLTLIVIALVIAIYFITKIIGSLSIKNFQEHQAAIAKLNGYMEEMMAGQKVVKVFNHEQIVKDEFFEINDKARRASTFANILSGIMGPISNNLSHINYAICAMVGATFCISGQISLASLIEFLQHSKNFSSPLSRIMQQFNALTRAVAAAERIFNLLDEENEKDGGNVSLVYATFNEAGEFVESNERTGLWAWKRPTQDGYELIRLRGDVKFKDVDFSYDGKKQVLNDVSFYAKPGQKIAFVGSTGAGKTTITNLINRFYDISDGQILYDGIDVKEIKKSSLRSSLAMVLQDTHLFMGSVMDNIRYGRLDASDEEVIKAAKLANADEFITKLPEGYNTILSEDGANLSQGQRQLLAIARAAIADAPVLILDEATSSIDTRTEKLIEEGMDNLMAGHTVFVIAHRLSTVRNANAIMVLEHGEIIERGDHDDLLRQKGKYYQLYTGQFELD